MVCYINLPVTFMLRLLAAKLPSSPPGLLTASTGDGDVGTCIGSWTSTGDGDGFGGGMLCGALGGCGFLFTSRMISPYVTRDCVVRTEFSVAASSSTILPSSLALLGSGGTSALSSCRRLPMLGRLLFFIRLKVRETPCSKAVGVLGVFGGSNSWAWSRDGSSEYELPLA